MYLSNNFYNVLKGVTQVWLPAAGTLYFTLSAIWGLPNTEQVIGSITAIDTFLGVGLAYMSKGYTNSSDGKLVVDKSNPAKDVYNLELTTPLSEIEGKDKISLAVHHGPGGTITYSK